MSSKNMKAFTLVFALLLVANSATAVQQQEPLSSVLSRKLFASASDNANSASDSNGNNGQGQGASTSTTTTGNATISSSPPPRNNTRSPSPSPSPSNKPAGGSVTTINLGGGGAGGNMSPNGGNAGTSSTSSSSTAQSGTTGTTVDDIIAAVQRDGGDVVLPPFISSSSSSLPTGNSMNQGQGQGQGQGQSQAQSQGQGTTSTTTTTPSDLTPNSDEQNLFNKLPSSQAIDTNQVDTSMASTVRNNFQHFLIDQNDKFDQAAQDVQSRIENNERAAVTSISHAASSFLTNHPEKADDMGKNFGKIVINVIEKPIILVKSVTTISITVVLLIVNNQVDVAKACVSSFLSFLVAQSTCNVTVIKVIQVFFEIITVILVPTHVTTGDIFG